MTRREQTLYRDTNDKMISGVCSGIGRYFDIDTTLVRVGFVVATMLGGGGILGYLILLIVLDPAPEGYWDELIGEPEAGSAGLDDGFDDAGAAVDLTAAPATDQPATGAPITDEARP